MGEERVDLALVDLKIGRLVLVAVDDGGDDSTGAEVLHGIAADIGAGPGGKFDLFGHGMGCVGG
jgi:hypothetical protein